VANPIPNQHEIWTFNHQLRKTPSSKILRIILDAEATISWSTDSWASTQKSKTSRNNALNLWYADLPAKKLTHKTIEFTFFWEASKHGEGKNFSVEIIKAHT
jgi:hypothetical protein